MSSVFAGATTFNGDISSWDVSSVTDMGGVFTNATSLDRNFGGWYVAIDSTSIDRANSPGVVGIISS
jgi:surface protein